MAQDDKDDLADALKRLARGDAHDDSDDAAPSDAIPLDIPEPASKLPQPAQPMRPIAPPPRIVRAAPKPKPPTSGKARPATPALFGTPAEEESQPQEVARPAARASAGGDDVSSSLANVIDDSDLSVPFEAIPSGPRIAARSGPSKSLQTRRTLIPILLTLGVCLPLLAAWWFGLDADAPMKEVGLKFPVVLLGIGAVMLLLAVVNMLSVRQELSRGKG